MEAVEQPTSRVFVGNLAWATTDEELGAFMAQSGEVLSSKVQRHEDTTRSKGWGLVEYATAASAVDAVQRLDGMELGERRIHVRFDRSHYDTAGGTTVFVGNLPWSTTDGELHELFSAYHPYSCSVMKNMAGRSRGFAIVRFQSEEQAQRAILDMNGYDLSGRVLEVRVDRGPGRSAVTERRSLFVGNLALTVADSTLKKHFSTFGNVVHARVQRRANGESKGWGLVEFTSPEEAAAAITQLNGSDLEDSKIEVRYDEK